MIKKFGLKLKEQKGFTLIELLAVIVILGIIAAIAIPAIGKVISNSKEDAKIAEALQIIDAAKLAHVDNSSTLSWSSSEAADGTVSNTLSNYISKVKDTTWTVTFAPDTNVWTLTNHDASPTTAITENELAKLAR